MVVLSSAVVTKSSIVKQAHANIFNLINNRSNVVDPLGRNNRKFVYQREPYHKSAGFAGYPYIIVFPGSVNFGLSSVSGKIRDLNWEFEIEVHSSDNIGTGRSRHNGKGAEYADDIADDILQTLNNLSNRQALFTQGMTQLLPDLTSSDVIHIHGETVFVRRFNVSCSSRLTISS